MSNKLTKHQRVLVQVAFRVNQSAKMLEGLKYHSDTPVEIINVLAALWRAQKLIKKAQVKQL